MALNKNYPHEKILAFNAITWLANIILFRHISVTGQQQMKIIAISKTKWYGFGKIPSLVREHIKEQIKNADKKGFFYKKARWIKLMPKRMKIGLLRTLCYNGLLFEENGRIVSNVFFQRHGNSLRVFSFWVEKQSRRKGIAHNSSAVLWNLP